MISDFLECSTFTQWWKTAVAINRYVRFPYITVNICTQMHCIVFSWTEKRTSDTVLIIPDKSELFPCSYNLECTR